MTARLKAGVRVRYTPEIAAYGTYLAPFYHPLAGPVVHALRMDDGRAIYAPEREIELL